jgi:hypothetical protein
MKKFIVFLLLIAAWNKSYSQAVIQTYTDRCTNVVYTFSVPYNGQTVVAFYNRSQVFTAADFTNGTLQAWLEQTYLWWSTLNPCSAAQAESTTAQQTSQQATQQATSAAANAAAAVPPPPPPPANTTPPPANNTSTNATSGTTDTSTNTGTDSTSSSQSSDTSSTGTGESSQGETSDTVGGGGSSEDTGPGETTESKSESSEETKTEKSSESEPESEEKVEEEKKEESKEEEKKEESEEESEEESDSESEEEKKEEDKKKEKKKNLAPPILAANLLAMQMLDGTWSTAASFGVSQSSLTGQETYGVNAMIWSNLEQFSLALSKSKVHFWRDKVSYTEVTRTGNSTKLLDGNKHKENLVHHVGSTSINYMYIFGTNVLTVGYSRVVLGQQDNFWKGFAGGYALTNSVILLPGTTLISPALTFFGTKPVAFKALPRWGFAPMVATSHSPIQFTVAESNVDITTNGNFTYIIGTGVNFNLTQRFVANLGFNTINNTDKAIPTTLAVTVGARFAF